MPLEHLSLPGSGARACEVRVGPGALADAAALLRGVTSWAVVTDREVERLHLARLGPVADAPVLRVPRGEEAKRLAVVEELLDGMAAAGLDRGSALVTLGGGSVSDVGGLAAALFMRGIDVLHAPTTLLAQVDAAVGGKTAVNLAAGKNLAGAFHQPRAVLADADTLTTLPEGELRAGLGEALKTALVAGDELLAPTEAAADRLAAREPVDRDALAALATACIRVKGRVVAADEREAGPRKQLNLGHTFAHAIEQVAGPGSVRHGEAVAVGVGLALAASAELGLLEDEALPARVDALAAALGLPGSIAELTGGRPLEAAALVEAMRLDKKGRARRPALVLVRAAGRLALDVEPPEGFLEAFLAERLAAQS